jgi:transposase InsO family protein
VTVYRMISAEKAEGFPVSLMCDLLGVSRSGYHDWERRAPSDRALQDAWLLERIKDIWAENRRVYGAPRVHAELRLRYGIRVGRKRVQRMMRQAGISGLISRKRGRTTIRVPGVRVADEASSAPRSPTCCGSRTSLASAPGKAGRTSRRCRTRSRGGSWAGRWPTTCATSWSSTPSPWPSGAGALGPG